MSSVPSWVKDGVISTEALKEEVATCARKLASGSPSTQGEGANQLYQLIIVVWAQETHIARDAADLVCDEIRKNGGLQSLLQLCSSAGKELRLPVMRALEQIMVAANRHYIAKHEFFDSLVKVACTNDSGLEAIQCGTGILENLFKESAETCLRLVRSGALEGIIYACRYTDSTTLQHCAAALANCAMYGEHKCQSAMVSKKADHWLFPLAFSTDNVVKYYALLAVCFLAANAHLAERVTQSGTLELVLPFLNNQDMEEFVRRCPNHAHGRSAEWLQRLVPLLVSSSEEARSLTAFHFAMEAEIKKKQQRLHVFTDIDAVSHLERAAKQGSHLTSRLCCQALTSIGAPLPPYQCWNVLQWPTERVVAWVTDIGLPNLAPAFQEHLVTGSLLLDLAPEDLLELGFHSKLRGKWFLAKVKELRCLADVSIIDQDNVCEWLVGTSQDLDVYRFDFVRSGITRSLLPHLTEDMLLEIGVRSQVDRLKILLGIGEVPEMSGRETPDGNWSRVASTTHRLVNKYDAFISYRRSTGSQLASLLKVHLQVRGVSVFLDVAELGSGKFDEALLKTISHAHNMIIILSPESLKRCIGDARVQDWVHKELACALENGVHIVPVISEQFQWPKESDLPADIRPICKMNGVRWIHDYQDASVDKVVNFLKLPPAIRRRSVSVSLHT